MSRNWKKSFRKWNLEWHRDLGYFFSSLLILYCISGLALNHVNEWNPDFVIERSLVQLGKGYTRGKINPDSILSIGRRVGESSFKAYDFPTPNQVKIYYEDATMHVHLDSGEGEYEHLTRRPLFYESNVLHRNSLEGWKWVADLFSVMLIVITITGLFILRGKYGFRRRGVWIMLAGAVLPVGALIIYQLKNAGV